MARSVPPFSMPSGIMGVKINPRNSWESRSFPKAKSDGQSAKWPPMPPYRKSDSRNYLIRLAHAWAQRDGSAKPGRHMQIARLSIIVPYTNSCSDTHYYLDDLPAGYGTFEVDQPSGQQVYKRLFGHPSGKFYDSILRFEPHFFWLLDGQVGDCTCVNCGKFKHTPGPARMRTKLEITEKATRAPRSALLQDRPRLQTEISTDGDTSSRSESIRDLTRHRQRRNRNTENLPPVDEEGTFNVYRDAIVRLYNQRDSAKGRNFDILEKGSIDWTAERDILQEYLTQIDLQHAFVPRRGELVLWCVSMPENHTILRDQNGHYKLYDRINKHFAGYPRWRAGVVAAVPSAASKNGIVDFADILENPSKQTALNTAGFRVETMPDPNDDTHKSLSKQYRYVAHHYIRPLSFWRLILAGIPQEELHPSILYALTCMTAISLVEKTKLVGHWNDGAYVSSKACYLGSELITVGDTIRLVPRASQNHCTDVLVVDSVRLELQGLREEHLEHQSQVLCKSSQVRLVGRAFTIDKSSSYRDPRQVQEGLQPQSLRNDEIMATFRPVGTTKYGDWYPLHDMRKEFEVSHDQVLGRLYEADAVSLWTGQYQKKRSREEQAKIKPDLGIDSESINAGRRYATKADERIAEVPSEDPNAIRWLLSDHRAQALSLATINGIEVAAYHDIRTKETLREWRLMTYTHNNEPPMLEANSFTRKKINYDVRAAYGADLDLSQASNSRHGSGKTRGRPPGSRLINGKIYTAAQLAELTDIDHKSGSHAKQIEVANLDDEDTGDDLPQPDRQPHFRSSQMANAGRNDADEDLIDEQEDYYDAEEQAVHSSLKRPLKSRLAMYDDDDDDDEVGEDLEDDEDDEDVDDPMEDIELGQWQADKPAQRQPPSKSQIMRSVEEDYDDTLGNVEEYESEEDDYLEKWKAPQHARGGTEESEGGDYRPGESQ